MDVSSVVQMIAIAAFAMTGVIAVSSKGIDLFTACVMGTITAIGGGTVRDLILGVPVFWSVELNYIWVSLAASIVAFFTRPFYDRKHLFSLMLYLDAFGVSLFAIQASNKVWDLEFALPVAPVLMGVLTAIGGGLIRDVLAGHRTLLMSRELYAIPIMIGCIIYAASLAFYPESRLISGIACISLIFCMRAAVIYWGLSVPDWMMSKPKRDES